MPSLIPEILDKPGTHALVIGTSAYKHFDGGGAETNKGELFGMEQLTAAARSASDFAAWLLNEYTNNRVPLRSLRVLLSPGKDEQIHADIAAKLAGDFSSTIDNVKKEVIAFRNACNKFKENLAIVYIAGHGVQLTKTGAIVLLHDCGSNNHANLLEGAIDMAGVHAGFNHPDTAQTQFWFVDACRQKPALASRFETLAGAFTLDEPPGIAESNPMFLAATTDKAAYARKNGITLFNEALLWGLRGGIAAAPDGAFSNKWHVSALELVKRLLPRVKALAQAEGAVQTADPAGRQNDALLHEYPTTPKVDLRVMLSPAAVVPVSTGSLRHGQLGMIVDNYKDWPLQRQVDAGIYEMRINATNGFKSYSDLLMFKPPNEVREIDLTP
jgi:hypothetical protein